MKSFTGLQCGNVLNILRENQEQAYNLFKGRHLKMTVEMLETLVKFDYRGLEDGSNAQEMAQTMEHAWYLLLQAAECKYF